MVSPVSALISICPGILSMNLAAFDKICCRPPLANPHQVSPDGRPIVGQQQFDLAFLQHCMDAPGSSSLVDNLHRARFHPILRWTAPSWRWTKSSSISPLIRETFPGGPLRQVASLQRHLIAEFIHDFIDNKLTTVAKGVFKSSRKVTARTAAALWLAFHSMSSTG